MAFLRGRNGLTRKSPQDITGLHVGLNPNSKNSFEGVAGWLAKSIAVSSGMDTWDQ